MLGGRWPPLMFATDVYGSICASGIVYIALASNSQFLLVNATFFNISEKARNVSSTHVVACSSVVQSLTLKAMVLYLLLLPSSPTHSNYTLLSQQGSTAVLIIAGFRGTLLPLV